MQILLRRTQGGLGRPAKQEQEEISRNLVQPIIPDSVHLSRLPSLHLIHANFDRLLASTFFIGTVQSRAEFRPVYFKFTQPGLTIFARGPRTLYASFA